MVQRMRSFDLQTLVDDDYVVVKLNEELAGDINMPSQLKEIEEWMDPRSEDEYIILMQTVLFKSERDAAIFKLKYG